MKSQALLLFFALCSPALARDWSRFPAVVEVDKAPEVFAVGDAHSDPVRLAKVLQAAHVIDAQQNWIAGSAVLVSTGDMIDKGPSGLGVIRLLRKLRDTAPAKGGRVVLLAGNHEAEFLSDPTLAKVKMFAGELKAAGMQPADVAACKGEIGEFLCTLPFAARVNDTFFSHAGNSGGRTIARLEKDIETDFDQHGFAAAQLIGDGSVIEARLNGEGKGREPWIDAGLPQRGETQLLTDYTKALGVARIVEGHVPSEVKFEDNVTRAHGEMFQKSGLLFLIDTGMSEGVNDSQGAVLHLTFKAPASAEAICPDGHPTPLWDAAAKQPVGRAAPCGR